MLGPILGSVDGITLEIDVGTKLNSLDGSIDVSNEVNFEGLLLEH